MNKYQQLYALFPAVMAYETLLSQTKLKHFYHLYGSLTIAYLCYSTQVFYNLSNVVSSDNLHCSQEYIYYSCSRTIIRVYPSKFCPRHFVLSNRSASFIDKPIPQILSFTAHSANIAFSVLKSCSFKYSFCENFANRPL